MQLMTDNLTTAMPQRRAYLTHALTPNQNAGIIALHFVAMYLELSIYSGGSLIFPYAGSTLVAIVGAVVNRSAIKSNHLTVIMAVVSAVAVSSIFAAVSGNVVFSEFVRSFLQFITAIVSAYCIFLVFVLSSRKRLIFLLSLLLIIITVGAFLERFVAVRELSDAFRTWVYPQDLLYSSDSRDIASYGAVRPRFLAREPSIVGIGAGLLISTIFLLWEARPVFRVTGAFVAALICIVIMRTPTIIFFAAIVFYGAISLRPSITARLSWIWAVLFAAVLIGLSFALTYGSGLGGAGIRSVLGGGSYILRVFGPPLIWLETLRNDALFGLGLGSFDALLPLARHTYGVYGIFSLFPFLKNERNGAFLITNGFWEYWIFFGLVGGSLIIYFLFRLFRSFGLAFASFPFFAMLMALQTFGGISAYRPWHMLFVFAAIALIVQRDFREPQQHTGVP